MPVEAAVEDRVQLPGGELRLLLIVDDVCCFVGVLLLDAAQWQFRQPYSNLIGKSWGLLRSCMQGQKGEQAEKN